MQVLPGPGPLVDVVVSHLDDSELKAIGFKSVGPGVKLSRKASIYGAEAIELGAGVRIDDFCVLSAGRGGICIGRNVHIAVMTSIIGHGAITIGDFCNLSSRVSLYSSSDDYSGEFMTNPTVPARFTNVDAREVRLGRHVIVGSGSVILPGTTIGDNVAIGALSLVTGPLAADGIYAGTPARLLKTRAKGVYALEQQLLDSE